MRVRSTTSCSEPAGESVARRRTPCTSVSAGNTPRTGLLTSLYNARVIPWLGNVLAIGALAALALSQAPPAQTLAITSVNVIDVSATTSATALLTNRTVVITGTRITAIGEAGSTAVPAGAQRLDGRGKYLMPGLWDMHAHALTEHEWTFPLFIANGVTGIREMGTIVSYDRINEIRRGVAEGTIIGPRIGAATARILDGVGGRGGPMTPVATGDEGRRRCHSGKDILMGQGVWAHT